MKKIKLSDLVYVAESDIHGKGLFARRTIQAGEYIGEFKGPEVTQDGEHVLWTWEGKWRGRQGRNALRYLNHSSRANAEFRGFDLYALRQLKCEQEITIDYGWS